MNISEIKRNRLSGSESEDRTVRRIGMVTGGLDSPVRPVRTGGRTRNGGPLALRLLVYGSDGLEDWEIVELILKSSRTTRSREALAKSLIARFGSLGGVISASVCELNTVAGIGHREVTTLKAVQVVATRMIKGRMPGVVRLHNWDRLKDYLTSVLSYENVEQLRVLYLNGKNVLIGEEIHSRGTVNHVPVYPREIVKRALELSSSAVILVHNHPSGDPNPSGEDVNMTIKIKGALDAVEITLHDHIIVGPGFMVSFRSLQLLPFAHLEPTEPYRQRHHTRRWEKPMPGHVSQVSTGDETVTGLADPIGIEK